MTNNKARPTQALVVKTFFLLIGCACMITPSTESTTMAKVLAITAGWAFGGCLVCLAVFVNFEYGTESFGLLYGSFLAAGGFGYYAFNEVLFGQIFSEHAEANYNGVLRLKEYGEWNSQLFTLCLSASFVAFVCTILADWTQKVKDAF